MNKLRDKLEMVGQLLLGLIALPLMAGCFFLLWTFTVSWIGAVASTLMAWGLAVLAWGDVPIAQDSALTFWHVLALLVFGVLPVAGALGARGK